MKTCPACKETKAADCFNKHSKRSDGLQSECRSCLAARDRTYSKTPAGRATQKRTRSKPERVSYLRAYKKSDKYKEKARSYCKTRYWKDPEGSRLRFSVKRDTLNKIIELFPVCVLCGAKENLQFDHMHPVSKGGSSVLENFQRLCGSCNAFKGSRLMTPGGAILLNG